MTIPFRNSEEETNFPSEGKIKLSVVWEAVTQEYSCLSCIPIVAISFSSRQQSGLECLSILLRPCFVMKKHNDFMQEYNNSWDHHLILAMVESSLDLKVSKVRLALSCGLLKHLLCLGSGDTRESQGGSPESLSWHRFRWWQSSWEGSWQPGPEARGHRGENWNLWKSAALGASWAPFFFREELLEIPLKIILVFSQPHNICFKLMFIW